MRPHVLMEKSGKYLSFPKRPLSKHGIVMVACGSTLLVRVHDLPCFKVINIKRILENNVINSKLFVCGYK